MKLLITKESTLEIKGIAILMVIIGHVSSRYGSSVLNYMGAFGVALFLFISGYGLVMSYNKNGLNNFFKKRFINVFIPYVAITTIWIIFDLIKGKIYSLKTYVLLLIGFDYNRTIDETMWYISFILLWYIIFYIIFKCTNKNLLRVILLFSVSFIFYKFQETGIMMNFSWQWYLHAFTFPIGVVAATYLKEGISPKTAIALNIISLILIIFLLNKIQESMYVYISINIIIAVFMITLVIIKNSRRKSSNGLCLVGKYSYELYLVEGYSMKIFLSSSNRNLALLVYIIAVISLSYIIKKVFNIAFGKNMLKEKSNNSILNLE